MSRLAFVLVLCSILPSPVGAIRSSEKSPAFPVNKPVGASCVFPLKTGQMSEDSLHGLIYHL